MPRFQDIPQFTRNAPYGVDISWDYLARHYMREVIDYGLDVNPDFQRDYVWTPEQKVRYVEFVLQGGMTGKDLYLNCPGHKFGRVGPNYGAEGYYVLVDGKQRLDAVLGFMNDEFPIFGGNFRRDYPDNPHILTARFHWNVNDLATREEVLQWYIDLNAGGTVHRPEEIDRVRVLKAEGKPFDIPSHDDRMAQAGVDREIIQAALREERKQEEESRARAALREAEEAAKPKRKARRK